MHTYALLSAFICMTRLSRTFDGRDESVSDYCMRTYNNNAHIRRAVCLQMYDMNITHVYLAFYYLLSYARRMHAHVQDERTHTACLQLP